MSVQIDVSLAFFAGIAHTYVFRVSIVGLLHRYPFVLRGSLQAKTWRRHIPVSTGAEIKVGFIPDADVCPGGSLHYSSRLPEDQAYLILSSTKALNGVQGERSGMVQVIECSGC